MLMLEENFRQTHILHTIILTNGIDSNNKTKEKNLKKLLTNNFYEI